VVEWWTAQSSEPRRASRGFVAEKSTAVSPGSTGSSRLLLVNRFNGRRLLTGDANALHSLQLSNHSIVCIRKQIDHPNNENKSSNNPPDGSF